MTKSQIKAELRRSACNDKDPWAECNHKAFDAAWDFLNSFEAIALLNFDDQRTFYLLTAEAL